MSAPKGARPRGVCPVCGDDVPLYGPNGQRDHQYVGRHRGAGMAAGCPGEHRAPDERPDPTIPPISWCRVFQVGPVCPRLCEDCGATYRRGREMKRDRRTGTVGFT